MVDMMIYKPTVLIQIFVLIWLGDSFLLVQFCRFADTAHACISPLYNSHMVLSSSGLIFPSNFDAT